MKIERLGVIINTEKYSECVSFYLTILEAEIMFELDDEYSKLTCLQFGDCYLMVEAEGVARRDGKRINECPTKIRINVTDVMEAQKKLLVMGTKAEVRKYPWGTVINTFDPDGNRVGIRDEAGFYRQVQEFKAQQAAGSNTTR